MYFRVTLLQALHIFTKSVAQRQVLWARLYGTRRYGQTVLVSNYSSKIYSRITSNECKYLYNEFLHCIYLRIDSHNGFY